MDTYCSKLGIASTSLQLIHFQSREADGYHYLDGSTVSVRFGFSLHMQAGSVTIFVLKFSPVCRSWQVPPGAARTTRYASDIAAKLTFHL